MKELHALIVGINDYPRYPLNGCLNDVSNVKRYLEEHLADRFDNPPAIKTLSNQEATKENIIAELLALKDVSSSSTVLIYFTGHGAQEDAGGRFTDEHDGLIECLVCYDNEGNNTLLSDKEIRFVFNQFSNDPHLLTIFDCCYAGDMTKGPEDEEGVKTKKIYGSFPPRNYQNFYFHQTIKESQLGRHSDEIFGLSKNHIHIAACLSSQQSTERKQTNPFDEEKREIQGVLTNYLLRFLLATDSNVNYEEIYKWANISLKDVTSSKQIPTITRQGEGRLHRLSGWMGVANLEDKNLAASALVYNSEKKKWYFDKGLLWGVEKGMKISVIIDPEETVDTVIDEVGMNESSIVMNYDLKDLLEISNTKGYKALLSDRQTTFEKLKIYINDIDQDDPNILTDIRSRLGSMSILELVERDNAQVFLNIFNKTLYFSFPQDEFQFRPLAEQLDLLDAQLDLDEYLNYQVPYYQRWFYLKTLKNPGQSYDEMPIKVEIQRKGESGWTEIGDNEFYKMHLDEERIEIGDKSVLGGQYKIRVTKTKEGRPIFIGGCSLWADMEIDTAPLGGVIELKEKGESALIYGGEGIYILDEYIEFYNWRSEPVSFKFIVSNSHFDIEDLKQSELPHPWTKIDRGIIFPKDVDSNEDKKTWQVYTVNIDIMNPTVNKMTGLLLENLEEVSENERLAGFIPQLYFDDSLYGYIPETKLKPNQYESSEEATKANHNLVVRFANKMYNIFRKRRFKKRLKKGNLPVIVAEGDSWFLLPKPWIKDTISYISKNYNVRSLADAGDELKDFYENGEFLGEIAKHKPEKILLSGGGNDVMGPQMEDLILKNLNGESSGLDFLDKDKFVETLNSLEKYYVYFIEGILDIMSMEENPPKIYVHGYAYIRTDSESQGFKEQWANKYMRNAGIEKPEDRKIIVRHLVDSFNEMLARLSNTYSEVVYVNNRPSLEEDDWSDEIHPDSEGYEKVAMNFLRAMK